jgi:hypothetical protein
LTVLPGKAEDNVPPVKMKMKAALAVPATALQSRERHAKKFLQEVSTALKKGISFRL